MRAPALALPLVKVHAKRVALWLCVGAFLLSGGWTGYGASAQTQAVKPTSGKTNNAELTELKGRISTLESEIASLESVIAQGRSDYSDLTTGLKATNERINTTLTDALNRSVALMGIDWTLVTLVVTVVALLLGVMSLGAYQTLHKVLSDALESEVKTRVDQRIDQRIDAAHAKLNDIIHVGDRRVQAASATGIGVGFWHYFNSANKAGRKDDAFGHLDLAIYFSNVALKRLADLKDPAAVGDDLTAVVKANYASYLADRGENKDKALALQLAREALQLANRKSHELTQRRTTGVTNLQADYDSCANWIECCCWAFWRFGSAEEKLEVRHILNGIYDSKDVSDSLKAVIREKWKPLMSSDTPAAPQELNKMAAEQGIDSAAAAKKADNPGGNGGN